MNRYRDNPQAVADLVREDAVHRDVYIDQEIFDLEMEHLFGATWVFVGHDSQVPKAGDYTTTDIGRVPVIMVRGDDGEVRVLMNRCAHKGAKLVSAPQGNCGRFFRCPYHGWSYKLDGQILAIPVKDGYAGTGLSQCQSGKGIVDVPNTRNYRGFVFANLDPHAPSLETYFGESLTSIDNMVERAPEGRLEVAGGVLRYLHDCNWKMFVENLNDSLHPMVAHESSAGTARKLWAKEDPAKPKPMVIEQFVPFVSGHDFFDKMGVRIFENGHSYTGVNFSIHSAYSAVSDYERLLIEAKGEERARAILSEARHNTVYYPTLTIKGAIQAIRIARPIGPDKTMIESWTFRLAGAPDALLQRTLMYSRLINAPTSVVGHDDLHCYRAIQEGLAATGNDWVSLHRGHDPAERESIAGVYPGNNEVSMRGQYRAWKKFMLSSMLRQGNTAPGVSS
ncbi:MAG: aromatic ring-hydroxylating dioxygenase subunit alpha [Burkholderiaceae bacterium]